MNFIEIKTVLDSKNWAFVTCGSAELPAVRDAIGNSVRMHHTMGRTVPAANGSQTYFLEHVSTTEIQTLTLLGFDVVSRWGRHLVSDSEKPVYRPVNRHRIVFGDQLFGSTVMFPEFSVRIPCCETSVRFDLNFVMATVPFGC